MSATNIEPCPHCRHGFAQDYSFPPETRLRQCDECRGTGRIPTPTPPPTNEDRANLAVDDEINRRREHGKFEPDHFGK